MVDLLHILAEVVELGVMRWTVVPFEALHNGKNSSLETETLSRPVYVQHALHILGLGDFTLAYRPIYVGRVVLESRTSAI